jgi:catechol 2,3-dioxygenase-like lactoylglutathione lyase family enzyme
MSVLTRIIGFVTTNDAGKTRAFYGDVLGFRLMDEDDYALVFDANGTMLRVIKGGGFQPAQGTVLGWNVEDVHAAVRELAPCGVHFEQFGLPFLQQDELGV